MKRLSFALALLGACSHLPTGSTPVMKGVPLLSKFPQIAPAGEKVLLSYVTFDEVAKTESLMLEECDRNFNCEAPEVLRTNPFTFNPRLHSTRGSTWLSWCEARAEGRGFYPTSIKLQQVHPDRGEVFELAGGEDFNCGQSLQLDDRFAHVAHENATSRGMQILYKKVNLASGKIVDRKLIAKDTLVRRPSLVLFKGKVVVGYDRWSSKNRGLDPVAPNYDVELAFIEMGKLRTEKFEATPGLEQAPSLRVENNELYLVYHQGPAILKHWELRKWNGKKWQMPRLASPFRNADPGAENQGAEFPQLMGLFEGSPVFTSRPSHSAFVHTIDGGEVRTADLDKDGWGARDLWMSGFVSGDELLLARRGHKNCQLEKVKLQKGRPIEWVLSSGPIAEAPSKDVPIRYTRAPGVKFGDVHMHSGYSDGTGAPDEIYARAYARKLDFAALTDHDTIVASRLFPSQYLEIMMLTDLFDALPGFTAIQAFEWTTPPIPTGFGHKNVYFKGRAPVPVFSAKHEHSSTPKLYEALREKAHKGEVFTAPHHTGWTGTDWENADPKIQRHFEVASVHGVFEDDHDNPLHDHSRPAAVPEVKGGFARDGFKKGHQFGFIAGSDAHGLKTHHGHGRHDNPWTQGLTGVFTNSEKREVLFSALYAQKTFATTGPFSSVRTWVTPAHALKHHHVDTTKLRFHYDVRATTPLKELVLVWNGEVVWKKAAASTLRESGRIDLGTLPRQKGEHHSLYLRAVQESEHQMNREIRDQVDIIFSGPILF